MKIRADNLAIRTLQIMSVLFYLAMVFVNFLANFLPINGKSTGEVSAQYPNLFVPAPLTFSIWGLIYFLLLIFCIFQLTNRLNINADSIERESIKRINKAFILTCLINMCWIIAWHYDLILLSVILILLLLNRLIGLNTQIRELEPDLTGSANFIVKAPFGLYLGWICIATIANIATLLVNYGWRGAVISEESWTSMMILMGSFIGFVAVLKFNNIYIGLAIIWALSGIIIERNSHTIYYRYIVLSALAGIILLTIAVLISLLRSTFNRKTVRPDN